MNHELKTIRTASRAISKFYNGSYPEMVKNPVLLLNYLYQHSYISRPTYTVIFEEKNPPCFVVLCVVDQVRTHGTGSSKKLAKTHSAQEMLNLIRNFEDNLSNTSMENCEPVPVDSSSETSYSQILTQCDETLPLQSADSSFDPSVDIVQPQWDNTETVLPQSLKRAYANEDYSMETDYESKKEIDFGSTNGEIMSLADYFDPYYGVKTCSQSSVSSSNSDAENIKPGSYSSGNTNDDPAKYPKTKSKNNRSKKEPKRAKLSTVSTSYLLDSYFDPFLKLKPPVVSCVDRNISRACTNTKVNEVRAEPDSNKSDKASNMETEVHKMEKTKSPFAILQEKSIKNLKLIPRCTIDKDGEVFKCKLVLDSFSIHSVGFVLKTYVDSMRTHRRNNFPDG